MVYGYARVSTAKQAKNGNSLQEQKDALMDAGAQTIVSDAYTGTKMDRPQLSKLLKQLQAGDKLIVTKLDRLARTATEGGALVKELQEKGVTIHILNMGVADDTPMGNLMVNMLLAFAQFERDMIVERTQAGRATARANGVRVDGRPKKFTAKQLDDAIAMLKDHTYTEVERQLRISKSTLIREIRRRKVMDIEAE